jgi:hypothetical protein
MPNATTKQVNFIIKLRAERNLEAIAADVIARADIATASNAIETLLAMPKPQAARQAGPCPTPVVSQDEVPAGRYALEVAGGEDTDGEPVIKFYKIEHGKAGTRWEGYTFVKAQASDDLYPIKAPAERERILKAIAADMPGAMALYGREIGRCGHCHKVLTSEWRKKGIGPICYGKMGW